MELLANELSIDQYVFDSYEKKKNFSDVYQKLRKLGITTCRINPSDLLIIQNSLQNDASKRNLRDLLYAFLRTPFESENIENKECEYYGSEWKCSGRICLGLAMSYLTDSISFSFDSIKWPATVQITRNGNELDVRNIAGLDHVDYHTEWIESFREIELLKSSIDIDKKKITLRDDHGKDILLKLAKRVIKCPYVDEIINSLPFNGKEKNFIKSFDEKGLVECVLPWTDEGYGFVVQTTGRNYRETEKIAELLRNKFGYK